MRGNLSCILECKNPLWFHLIIDKKHFGGEKDGELKSCDAGSLGGESSKLSEGIYYISSSVSQHWLWHQKSTFIKWKTVGILHDNVLETVEYIYLLEAVFLCMTTEWAIRR